MANQPVARPTGVTIMAILAAIGGAFTLLGAIALIGLGGFLAGAGSSVFGSLALVVGLIVLVQAGLLLGFAYGAWTLKPWAWILGIASAGLSLVMSAWTIVSGGAITDQAVSIAVAVIILYYLFTPQVKAAFGRA